MDKGRSLDGMEEEYHNITASRRCPKCGMVIYQDTSVDSYKCVGKKCRWHMKVRRDDT